MKRAQGLVASSAGGGGRAGVVVMVGASGVDVDSILVPPPTVAPVLLGVYGGGIPVSQLLSLSHPITGSQVGPYGYQG